MKHFLILSSLIFLFACNHTPPKAEVITKTPANSMTADAGSIKYDSTKFAMATDANCGMPLKDGVGDTTTYKGKLYGFCSKECKESFLKNPEALLK